MSFADQIRSLAVGETITRNRRVTTLPELATTLSAMSRSIDPQVSKLRAALGVDLTVERGSFINATGDAAFAIVAITRTA